MAAFLLAHTINENYTVDIVDAHQELEPENTAEAYKESQNELTSKIIQSNHQPITPFPLTSLSASSISWTPPGMLPPAPPVGSLFQCLATLSGEKNFPNIQREPPGVQLEAITFCPVATYWEKRRNFKVMWELLLPSSCS